MPRRLVPALLLLALLLGIGTLIGRAGFVVLNVPEAVTAGAFEAMRSDLRQMRAFLQRMPKGADLHTHLSGAVYAERLIAWAAQDGLCLSQPEKVLVQRPADAREDAPCGADPGLIPVAQAVSGPGSQTVYGLLVDAYSMRAFVPTPQVPSGHDQFFATFGKFGAATGGADTPNRLERLAEMTADQLRAYDAAAVQYAEFMFTFLESAERRRLAAAIGTETEPKAMLAALQQAGLKDFVRRRADELEGLRGRIEALLGCAGGKDRPGCGVGYSFIAQVNRNAPPAEVFVQTAVAAALVRTAPRLVVGLNFVGPEDHRTALRDYHTHMAYVAALAPPDVPVALHAGELWLGLVPPADLDFHIREAVEVAGARRIGHGTAIGFERDMPGLLAEMARREVAVEIALTSSDLILGVRGREHPISTYVAAGVPVVLATDDAGVSRIDLTHEFVRAARDHGFDYRALKAFAYNAIRYAFLPAAEKEAQMRKLAVAFSTFERTEVRRLSFGERARAILSEIMRGAKAGGGANL
ncbi:adenosine deaminase family protein [Aquabacter sp. P-9]|uniref:adenosine deaminase family protein n=1 Tax=Aquabacter sediminis TaxID=3029197 RepID=UPI00237E249A|nr:adenosine deaminase [Aquabacter sp. P-9]MDE1569961.1 adenosine deaminase [Aquabacter sp. P-9]